MRILRPIVLVIALFAPAKEAPANEAAIRQLAPQDTPAG
jgi:hypothetical protein